MLEIKELKNSNEAELNGLKKLLTEYGHYMYEEIKLIDGKDTYWVELTTFPGKKYKETGSTFLLALYNGIPAGCVGLRRFDASSCEMKRMYVNPQFRRLKIGHQLCEEIINLANKYGYAKMLLDTNKEMASAVSLYLKYGFKEIPPYCINNNQHPIYLSKKLTA